MPAHEWTKSVTFRAQNLQSATALTDPLASDRRVDLVVWPETTVLYVPRADRLVLELLQTLVSKWGAPLLTGPLDGPAAPAFAPDAARNGAAPESSEMYNAAVLLEPRAEAADPLALAAAGLPAVS